tara:strand:+ start:187 stop:402 length:216 start_codon:yes stop_codon:yes gene_type:complete
MAKIDDLKKSLSDMSDEELMEALKDVRTKRRTPVRKFSGKKKSQTINVKGLTKGMSTEALQSLLKELGANE